MPTLKELEQRAAQRVEAVLDEPHERLALRREFYQQHGVIWPRFLGFNYGRSELAFMDWEIKRGVLNPMPQTSGHPQTPGSSWWREVNQELIYPPELAHLMHVYGAACPAKYKAPCLWLQFIDDPSPQRWYLAHNYSVVQGYLKHIELAKEENAAEQHLLNIVLYRVLFAHYLVEKDVFFADPRSLAVTLLVHMPAFYPATYPLPSDHQIKEHTIGSLRDLLVTSRGDSLFGPDPQKGMPEHPWLQEELDQIDEMMAAFPVSQPTDEVSNDSPEDGLTTIPRSLFGLGGEERSMSLLGGGFGAILAKLLDGLIQLKIQDLYQWAAELLDLPELADFLDGDKPIYPRKKP